MSYLAEALTELMESRGLKNIDVARASGLDQSSISRWVNGVQTSINDDDLEALANVVAKTPREKATLVAARMRDVCTGPGSHLIQMRIDDTLISPPSEPRPRKLAPKLEDAFEVLRANVGDPDLKDIILSLAHMFTREEGSRYPEVRPQSSFDTRSEDLAMNDAPEKSGLSSDQKREIESAAIADLADLRRKKRKRSTPPT